MGMRQDRVTSGVATTLHHPVSTSLRHSITIGIPTIIRKIVAIMAITDQGIVAASTIRGNLVLLATHTILGTVGSPIGMRRIINYINSGAIGLLDDFKGIRGLFYIRLFCRNIDEPHWNSAVRQTRWDRNDFQPQQNYQQSNGPHNVRLPLLSISAFQWTMYVYVALFLRITYDLMRTMTIARTCQLHHHHFRPSSVINLPVHQENRVT